MTRERYWKQFSSREEATEAWDQGSKEVEKEHPLKLLKSLPKMDGISKETAKNLKWKAIKYMVQHDADGAIRKQVMKHPVRYVKNFVKSALMKKPFTRSGDCFFYGIESVDEFKKLLKDPKRLFVLGFSYCHKPFECPSGRFTDQCIHDPEHPVCRQCFIGKAIHSLPDKNVIALLIPTVHYIGEQIFDIVHLNPEKDVVFLITACEMTLEMFGDLGNMAEVKGIGIRLDGRICNTMKAFELSEQGIKPGLTVVLDETQRLMLSVIEESHMN
jgi:hypothetical protein